MKQYHLKVNAREATGRGPTRRLRLEGRIPGVIYGESGTRSLSFERGEFLKLWKEVAGRTTFIQVEEEGWGSIRTMIQETQMNSLTDEFLHVDFKEISAGVEMQAPVAIRIVGEAEGVKNEGGLLEIHNHEVGVRCLPRHLPEFIEIDVSALHAGDSFHIRDLKPIEKTTFTDDPDKSIISCVLPALVEEIVEAVEDLEEGVETGEGEEAGKVEAEGKEANPEKS